MQLVTPGGASLRLTPPGTERLETARALDVGVTGRECNAAVAASTLARTTPGVLPAFSGVEVREVAGQVGRP